MPQMPTSKFSPQAFVPSMHPTNRVEAKYPDGAKRDKISGFVEILATVDPGGSVVETEVLEGKEVLRQAAIDAVKQWRFHPVLRNGQAVYAYTDIEVDVSNGEENNVPDNQSSDVFFTLESEFGTSSPMNRVFELMRTMPRTPQQELADLEQDLGDGSGPDRFWVLPQLAKAALTANVLDKASNYANDMLKADTHDPDYGQLLHDGHTTRGLVALRQGNVALASQDLREAGQTPGSPMLNALGPNLKLASELLQKGERAVVLEYLEHCKTFWKMGADRLDSWIATIRSGGMPDLSGNFGF
jgi:TonB family protein